MPDGHGNFKGQGWSRRKEKSWERIFAPVPSPRTKDITPLTEAQAASVMRMVAQMKP